jgi:hypothetical protein
MSRPLPVEIRAQHPQHVGIAFAAVDYQRYAGCSRKVEMAGEIFFLLREGREIPMAIQAGFAESHDQRILGQTDDCVPIARFRFGDVIGMQTRRSSQHRVKLGESQASGAGCSGGADGEGGTDSGSAGAIQHRGKIPSKTVIVQMGVSVH